MEIKETLFPCTTREFATKCSLKDPLAPIPVKDYVWDLVISQRNKTESGANITRTGVFLRIDCFYRDTMLDWLSFPRATHEIVSEGREYRVCAHATSIPPGEKSILTIMILQ